MTLVTRIDWVILRRLMSRIALTTAIIFGMAVLVESLNNWRFHHLSQLGGPLLGLAGIVCAVQPFAAHAPAIGREHPPLRGQADVLAAHGQDRMAQCDHDA